MPYPAEHFLLQWTGHFRSSQNIEADRREMFVGTLRFHGPGVATNNANETLVRAASALKAWFADPFMQIPVNCSLDIIKWNRIGTDGKYSRQGLTDMLDLEDDMGWGTAPFRYPYQVAWATTWLTSFRRGLASRGRTYWPTAAPCLSDGSVDKNSCSQMAAASMRGLNNLTAAINGSDGGGLVPVIASNVREGRLTPITDARVGARLDIQRRRGGSVLELAVSG